VVVVGRRVRSASLDIVRAADDDGVSQAVDHLAAQGHRAVVHVDGGAGTIATDRRRGYRRGMRRHRLAGQIRVLRGAFTERAGAGAAQALLADDALPTAVIAVNDRCAIGILDAFVRAGGGSPGGRLRRGL
jgi:DNA-binding LacI/PurR family transcriptional regulator